MLLATAAHKISIQKVTSNSVISKFSPHESEPHIGACQILQAHWWPHKI